MVIRKEQTTEFSAAQRGHLAAFLVHHLSENFARELADQRIEADQLDLLARQAISKAEEYDIVQQADVRFFAECLVLLGSGFDISPAFPWAGEILRTPGLTGRAKMDRIGGHMIFGLRPSK